MIEQVLSRYSVTNCLIEQMSDFFIFFISQNVEQTQEICKETNYFYIHFQILWIVHIHINIYLHLHLVI